MDGSGFVPEFPRRNGRKSVAWLILGLFWVFALITLVLSSPPLGSELSHAIGEFLTGH
jgi:hypothetical protein